MNLTATILAKSRISPIMACSEHARRPKMKDIMQRTHGVMTEISFVVTLLIPLNPQAFFHFLEIYKTSLLPIIDFLYLSLCLSSLFQLAHWAKMALKLQPSVLEQWA